MVLKFDLHSSNATEFDVSINLLCCIIKILARPLLVSYLRCLHQANMTTRSHFIYTPFVSCVIIKDSSKREIDKLSKVKQHNILLIYSYELKFFTETSKNPRHNLCPQFG